MGRMLLHSRNINNIPNAFQDTVNTVLDEHIPFTEKRVKRQHQPPWINKQISTAIKERDKLLKTARKSDFQVDWNQFKRAKCKTSNLIKKAKRNYFQESIEKNKGNPKGIWKALKTLFDSLRNAKM